MDDADLLTRLRDVEEARRMLADDVGPVLDQIAKLARDIVTLAGVEDLVEVEGLSAGRVHVCTGARIRLGERVKIPRRIAVVLQERGQVRITRPFLVS
jgi:hypothetical protein